MFDHRRLFTIKENKSIARALALSIKAIAAATMASYPEEHPISQDEWPPSIVYGPMTPVPLTLTFNQLLDHNVDVRGDQPAVISHPQNKTITWRTLRERSIRLARAMSTDGIAKGDLVAISLGSRIEYFETFFACTYLGAALVLLNYAYTDPEMIALLKQVST